jgi:hypothetical protein
VPYIAFIETPRIPNLPFFYLVFRAYSHWRALSGGKHIQYLLEKNLVSPKSSPILDKLYSTGKYPFDVTSLPGKQNSSGSVEEKMVLHVSDGKRIAEELGIPDLYVEIDRAVWQVEKALAAKEALKQEKGSLDSANNGAVKNK